MFTSGTLREKQNYVYTLPPLENLTHQPLGKDKNIFIPFELF
jgi:hypothetical protein